MKNDYQIGIVNSYEEYGLDVIALVGFLRYQHHQSLAGGIVNLLVEVG